MKIKRLETTEEWMWVKERTHALLAEDTVGFIAYDDRGIHAAALADDHGVDNCRLHIAIDSPLCIRHGFLSHVFDYVFITRGYKRVFGFVSQENQRALKFDKHIGFKEVGRLEDGFSEGVDLVAIRMDKSDCRWLSEIKRAA